MLFRDFFLRFCAVRKLFGVFLTYFEDSTEILYYFLCYFLKSPEFGRSPEIREQATTLAQEEPIPSCGGVGHDVPTDGLLGVCLEHSSPVHLGHHLDKTQESRFTRTRLSDLIYYQIS